MLRTAQSLPLEWAFDTGLRPRPFPDEAASLLPGPLAVTRTGLTPASDDELTTQDQPPTRSTSCLWAHGKASVANVRAGHNILNRRRRILGPDHPDTLTCTPPACSPTTCTAQETSTPLAHSTSRHCPNTAASSATITPTPSTRRATSPHGCATPGNIAPQKNLDADILARHRRVLGENHPVTIASRNNLAQDLVCRARNYRSMLLWFRDVPR